MKLKLVITLLAFIYFNWSLSSQEYYPLLNNSSWTVEVSDIGFETQTFTMIQNGEQTIGNYTYKKIVEPFSNNDIFIREDIDSKKVYKIINGQDELIFDFSLQIGEETTLSNGSSYQVQSITNINVIGGQRKLFFLVNQSSFPGYNEIWIEGVGNLENPLFARYEYFTDPVYSLKCSFQNGENIFNRGIYWNNIPVDCETLSVNQQLVESFVIAPNPFREELTVTSKNGLQNLSIKIYNLLGQEMSLTTSSINNNLIVSRENLKAGIYVLKISTEHGDFSKQIVAVD